MSADSFFPAGLPRLPEPVMEATRVGRTLVMGIVNVTPDSFSDGGRWLGAEAAIARARQLVSEGADLIDVGGESTRPGAAKVRPEEEIGRVEPVVRALVEEGIVVSVDTIHAATAQAVLAAGAHVINDVSGGLADPRMHAVVAEAGVPYICQHWRGNPEIMDTLTDYAGDVVAGVEAELRQRLDELARAGADMSQVIVDPGLGFAKTHEQSWQLLASTRRLAQDLGRPVLIGASRKRFLASTVVEDPSNPCARDGATAATSALAAAAGAWAVRVHEVHASRDAVRVAQEWKEAR